MGVFLDTNFLLGLLHPKDSHAERSNEILLELKTGKYGLLYTSNLILGKVATLAFIRTKGNQNIMNDLHDLIWGENKIATRLEVTKSLEYETWNFFLKINQNLKGKKGFMSFIDSSILVLAKNKNIDFLVSFEEHFDGLIKRIF